MSAPHLKPTIVCVPGAWHTPAVYQSLATLLSQKSYPTSFISLPSVDADPPLQDFSKDVEVIECTVKELLHAGRDVVLIVHSYGGVPGSEAMGNLLADNHDLGKNGKGKLLRMVWLCSFVPTQAVSIFKATGERIADWIICKDGMSLPADPAFRLYNDLDPAAAEHWASLLRPMSNHTAHNIVTREPFMEIGTSYLICENDNALLLKVQEGMVASTQAKSGGKAFDHVERCQSGHSPFLSMPEFVVGFLERAIAFEGRN